MLTAILCLIALNLGFILGVQYYNWSMTREEREFRQLMNFFYNSEKAPEENRALLRRVK